MILKTNIYIWHCGRQSGLFYLRQETAKLCFYVSNLPTKVFFLSLILYTNHISLDFSLIPFKGRQAQFK